MRRTAYLPLVAFATIFLFGCPKANQDLEAGRKAEAIGDYDTALVHYERALRSNPSDSEYQLREKHMRFEAGEFHVEQGEKSLQKGDLELALAEFQKAHAIDPSNTAADQEGQKTANLLEAKRAATAPKSVNPTPDDDQELLAAPPALKPLSREPITLTETNDCEPVFQTIAKLAGLSVIFDPDFTQAQQGHKITADLPNVTREQALDTIALECKAFWKPVTGSVIFVAPDSPVKRTALQDEEVRTFYLSNTLQSADITDIVSGLRLILAIKQIQQINAQNAIIIRDTPDKLALAAKMIQDIDKARPEILLHVQVLSANRDRLRDLGILPGQSVVATFNPRSPLQPGTTTSGGAASGTPSTPTVTLNNLHRLSSGDWSLTMPGATANAILTDSKTEIIQDPEIRMTDGEKAELNIGEKVPIATGSFQAGVGVGVGGGAGVVNPLVNTQFTYQQVGVNITVDDPHVHPDNDVSMKLTVEISSIAGESNLGGIQQPIISDTKSDQQQIRLKDGESSVLEGLIQRNVTTSINGIPGLAQMPLLRYMFSDNSNHVMDSEVLIVVTPHIIRFPSISAENLRTLAAGTESDIRVYRESAQALPSAKLAAQGATTQSPAPPAGQTTPAGGPAALLHFEPANVSLKPGDTATIGLAISNVNDLYSLPLLIHYNPAVVQVEEVRDGGFLAGGNQEIAIVQRIDAQRGEVVISATRAPNTPGVNGSGTLLGFVVRAVAPGNAALQVLEVNAHDSQQRNIPITSKEATIQVQ